MATRTISTRLVIDGEAEFKRAVTSINTELRKMSSELKLAEAQFAEQANTTEALQAKLKALQNVYDAQKKKTEELTKAHENAQKAQETYAAKDVAGGVKNTVDDLANGAKNAVDDVTR